MATPDDVLDVAAAEIGSTDGGKYFHHFGEADLGPYCVAFGRYCPDVAGTYLPWYHWYAFDTTDQAELGPWYLDKHDVFRGAGVCFDWDWDGLGDHFGFVESVQDWGLCTIEGNTSGGRVARQQRVWANVTCGCAIPYDGAPPARVPLDVDGACGHKTVKEWQRQMGTDPDGVISNQLWHNDQYRRCVWAIEHYWLDYQDYAYQGSSLVRAVQRRLGIDADGDWGPGTTRALQRQLKAWGYYTGRIDADFGELSVKALQESLNDRRWE